MPNSFAFLMVFAWPVLAFIAFRRLPLPMSVSAALIGAQLLLPSATAVNLPMLPSFDKTLSGTLAAFLLVAVALRKRRPFPSSNIGARATVLPGWLPRSRVIQICIAGLLASGAVTVYLNGDALQYGPKHLPALRAYDMFSATLTQIMTLLPFLIARKTLATPEAQKMFLITLVIAGAAYVLPTLYEVRMSPQLNRDIYGFFPASFRQHVRSGGFRPVVFFQHGLKLSLFLTLAFLAAIACARYADVRHRTRFTLAAMLLFGTLLLSKSLGAFVIALVLGPVMFFASARQKLLVAAMIAFITMSYPILRGNDLIPANQIVEVANSISVERGGSLQFRFAQEDILLEKAAQRPLFGWGAWGRSRVFNQFGADVSVTDGTWVILFGTGGWMKYLTTFGLLCLPILLMALRQKTLRPEASVAAVSLLLAANIIDLIPNSGLLPLTWVMAGALTGRLELQSETAVDAAPAPGPAERGRAPVFSPGLRESPLRTSIAPQAPIQPKTGGEREPSLTLPPQKRRNPYAPKTSKPGSGGA